MPRLTPVPWQVLECVFLKCGFSFERQSGSHRVYSKPGCIRPIIIPAHTTDPIDISIIQANMRTAGITRDEYFALLGECQ